MVRWSGGSALVARATTLALWLLLLTGPGVLVALLVTGGFAAPQAQPVVIATTSGGTSEQAAAGELAQRAVLAWLTTRRGQERSMPVPLPEYSGHLKPFLAKDLSVADIGQVGVDTWSVTVGATVTDTKRRTSRQYYQLPVQIGPTGSAVLALPAVVAAPRFVPGQAPKYRQPLSTQGPLGSTVSQFLRALTSGSGDVTRYVSPGQVIRAVSPAPFKSLTLISLDAGDEFSEDGTPADGARVGLLVSALGYTPTGQQLPVSYALTMQARAGRWEVASIQLAPDPNPTFPHDSATPALTSPTPANPSSPSR